MVNFRGVRIAGLSGIFKPGDYCRGHFEHPPYNDNTRRSCYHVRNVDIFRLRQVRRLSFGVMCTVAINIVVLIITVKLFHFW